MRAYAHRGWAHWQRVSTTFLTRKNSQMFLVLLTEFEPPTLYQLSHTVTPSYGKHQAETKGSAVVSVWNIEVIGRPIWWASSIEVMRYLRNSLSFVFVSVRFWCFIFCLCWPFIKSRTTAIFSPLWCSFFPAKDKRYISHINCKHCIGLD